jgi:hypothetical protein
MLRPVGHRQTSWRRFCIISGLAMLLASTAAAGVLAWLGARGSPPRAIPLGVGCLAQVVLVENGGTWTVESVGPLGHNASYDPDDPHRKSLLFLFGGAAEGSPRVWRERWAINAGSPPRNPSAEGLLARRALGDSIASGAWPVPQGLATTDIVTIWRPWNLLADGFERAPWAALIAAAPVTPIVLRAKARLRQRAGHCPTCGYSRTGLKPGSLCPECGVASAA